MTSKLTRERLEKIKSWRETYGAGSNVMLPAEEAEELARIALAAMDREHVRNEHAEWSQATFGNVGPVGPLKHLSKEALEAAAEPGDLSEWADMQFLLWDAQRRAGITDEQITQAMFEKLAVNKQREWPEPKDGEPRLHIKEQPAPVVPNGLRLALSNAGIAAPESDEMLAATCEKHIQALVTWVKDRKPFQSAPVVPSFEEWLSAANRKPLGWVKDAMREAYDACRADMLAAAPHDTPALNSVQNVVTVPGKWIPVSERMPEDEQEVLTINKMGHRFVSFFDKHSGLFFDRLDAPAACCIEHVLVTHWMPLPAAPQEAINALIPLVSRNEREVK